MLNKLHKHSLFITTPFNPCCIGIDDHPNLRWLVIPPDIIIQWSCTRLSRVSTEVQERNIMGISPGSGHRPLTLEWRNLLSDQPTRTGEESGGTKGVCMNISLTRANCMRYNCRVIRAHSWKMQSCFVQAERVLDFKLFPSTITAHQAARQSQGWIRPRVNWTI